MTNPAPPRLPRWVPIAVVAAACLALAFTAHRLDAVWPKESLGPLRDYRPIAAIAAFTLLSALVIQVTHYQDGREGLLDRAARACLVLLGTMTLVTPVGLIVLHRSSPAPPVQTESVPIPPTQTVSSSGTPTPTSTRRPGLSSPGLTVIIEIGLATIVVLVVVAIIVAVVLFLLRLWRSQTAGLDQNVGQLPFGTLADAEHLADAVDAAGAALDRGEAREAIIACYAAMERSMQDAGVLHQTSDSPEELLIHAARAGLVRGSAARRLTDLFREARFSAHAIDETLRTAAREALREIVADVRDAVAEQKAQAEEAARHAAGRNAELARVPAEGRQPASVSKRGTHR